MAASTPKPQSPPSPPQNGTDPLDSALDLHRPERDIYSVPSYTLYSQYKPKEDLAKYLPSIPEYLHAPLLSLASHEPPPDEFGLPDRRAAVCVALHLEPTPKLAQLNGEKPYRLEVYLTRRAAKMRTHGGEVALPGGRVDKEDRDAVHAALREAREEIGL